MYSIVYLYLLLYLIIYPLSCYMYMLEPISMKTFVTIKFIWSSTHDESRVQHDQDVPRRVDKVWFVKLK